MRKKVFKVFISVLLLCGFVYSNPVFPDTEIEKQVHTLYDSLMQQWPVSYSTQFIQTDYAKTHFVLCGDSSRPALVLIHGAWLNATMWADAARLLAPYFYLIAVDVPGDVGKSVLRDKRSALRSGEDVAQWFTQILDSLHIEKTSLMGLSMGAWFSLQIASRLPQRVEGVAVYAPMGLMRYGIARRALIKTVFFKPKEQHLDLLLTALAGENNPALLPFKPQYELAMKSRLLIPKLKRLPRRQLKDIHGRTYIVIGGRDILIGDARKAAVRSEKYIPQITTKILPDQAHAMRPEVADVIVSEMARFLLQDK